MSSRRAKLAVLGGVLVLLGAAASLRLLAHRNPKITPAEVEAGLVHAVALMEREALMGRVVAWQGPLQRAKEQAARTGRLWDFERALSGLVAELRALDGHSHYVPRAHAQQLQSQGPPRREGDAPLITRHADVAGVPLLRLAAWASLNAASNATATAEAARLLRQALQDQPCGLLLDLRDNSGGNMHPMLQAVSALLPPGDLGHFQFADGRREAWPVAARTGSAAEVAVGVLIGPQTASSGEFVALALRAAPHARFFGSPSFGVPTANALHPISQGGFLALTVATTLDHLGRPVVGRLAPDVDSAKPERLAADWVLQRCPVRTTEAPHDR